MSTENLKPDAASAVQPPPASNTEQKPSREELEREAFTAIEAEFSGKVATDTAPSSVPKSVDSGKTPAQSDAKAAESQNKEQPIKPTEKDSEEAKEADSATAHLEAELARERKRRIDNQTSFRRTSAKLAQTEKLAAEQAAQLKAMQDRFAGIEEKLSRYAAQNFSKEDALRAAKEQDWFKRLPKETQDTLESSPELLPAFANAYAKATPKEEPKAPATPEPAKDSAQSKESEASMQECQAAVLEEVPDANQIYETPEFKDWRSKNDAKVGKLFEAYRGDPFNPNPYVEMFLAFKRDQSVSKKATTEAKAQAAVNTGRVAGATAAATPSTSKMSRADLEAEIQAELEKEYAGEARRW